MSFSNINVSCVRAPFHADKLQDPAAVSALLDQLRASQAWRDVLAANPPQPRSEAEAEPSVANLLEQLQPPASSGPVLDRSPPPPARQEHRDLQSYTFQQALPVVANLASDPTFLLEIQKLKQAQDDIERRLWEERRSIQRKHEEKVKIAKTKATMIGVGLSKHEADMLNDAYKKELRKFDMERALPAFDGLIAKQQAALAHLNVPTMCVSDDMDLRERQQRVMQVLTGLVDSRDQCPPSAAILER
ncbi:hypothetical protein AX14_000236 [Amanita brunnescens Koide BX004]|nr:hypothetical protein AX14_000236 [Amanita brunnescens Koide BX004]